MFFYKLYMVSLGVMICYDFGWLLPLRYLWKMIDI